MKYDTKDIDLICPNCGEIVNGYDSEEEDYFKCPHCKYETFEPVKINK